MLGTLLVIDLLALSLAVYALRGQRGFLRESVLMGFILWASMVFLGTEALSLFRALGFAEVLVYWLLILACCSFIIYKHRASIDLKGIIFLSRGQSSPGAVRPWPFFEKVSFNRIVFFSFCLGVIALFSPPNTYDAMSYHMSRVMHWIQDGCVTYYPTNITLQLIYPPLAEYIILHFQLLSGGDHWANIVQWLAMCGSLTAVSLIARELGAARRGQVIAALIALTIPMGILQSTSTQTDYVDSLWLCCFIYFFFCWRRTKAWRYTLLVGACLGLSLATKGVALIYASPFIGWMAIEAARRLKIKQFILTAVLIGSLAGIFYSGIFYRNTAYFHGNAARFVTVTDSMVNARFCWEGFLANVIRNTGLHVITPSWEVNTSIKETIYHIASALHIDLNNKDWSFAGATFPVIDFRGNEDYLGNPLHLFLYGMVLVLFISSSRFRDRNGGFYLGALLVGWALFNAVLKWQPYHSRFHLGWFIIFAPLAGYLIERIRTRWVVSGAMGVLLLSATAIALVNGSKPIFNSLSIFYPQNREFLHFIRVEASQTKYLEYKAIAGALAKMGCKNIGLMIGPGDLEYLLWVVLNPSSDHKTRIENIFVQNASSSLKYPLGNFVPDAIIATNDDHSWLNWENNNYHMVWRHEAEGQKVSIFLKNT